MRSSTTILAAALTALLATPVLAQRVTGGIAGTVKDATGGVLPGVTVSVSGPNIVGEQTAVTNESGFYRFIGLPPGTYQVTFSLSGFSTQARSNVRVSVGAMVEENAAMRLSFQEETINVVAEAPVVDTSSNEVGSNYERDWVENAPLQRLSFLDLVAAAPGSLRGDDQSRRTMVFGASYDENSFQIDGTDVNDNFFNEVLAKPNTDTIEEIEVLSLGAPAEYGNLTGAVYNVVTRQGTNEFHGDLNFFWQTDGLTGRNTTDENDEGFPYKRDTFLDLTAQLGGPLVKDKLWFFGSYQYQKDEFSPATVDPQQFIDRALRYDRYFVKLNYQISPGHKLLATFHQDDYREPIDPGPLDAPSTFVARTGSTPTPGFGYTGILTDKTVVEVRYGGFYGDLFLGPADESLPRDQARFYNLDTSEITGGHYYWYDLHPKRTTINAKVSHLADDFLGGSHDFRFGVQYNTSEAGGVYGYNDLIYTYEYAGMQYGYGYNRGVPFSYSGNTRAIGVFFDDTFRVNERLSLNLGVRYDHNKAFSREQDELDASGRPTGVRFPRADHYTWKNVSPRLGFNLKLTGDGKTILKGHWGRYHRAIATGEFANVIGPSIKPIFFGFYDFATGSFFDLEQITDNSNLSVDPDYSAPRVDQFIVSFERELVRNLGVNLNYVHKKGRNFGAWRDIGGIYQQVTYIDDQGADATGRAITLFQLQNSFSDLSFMITNREEMDTEINAVSFGILKRMADNWSLNTSVTWLRAEGRTPDSLGPSLLEQRGGLQFRDFGQDPNDFVNTGGRLRGDTPWQVKAQLVYKLPLDFTAGVNFAYRTGANLVRQLRDVRLTQTFRGGFLGEERGELGRLPSGAFLDIRLQKDFKLGEKARLGVFADGFNLLNDDANEGTVSDRGTSSSYHLPKDFVLPRRLMVGAKVRF